MADFSPATKGVAVVTADNTKFSGGMCRGLYVGVTGDVVVIHSDFSTVTYKSLAAGVVHPIMAFGVAQTNTTATNIVALY